jgi:molecular chaperone DnaK
MPYVLGIHLGGTATSAAIARRDSRRWGLPAPFPLGSVSPTVPTVLCKVQDGSYVAGEPAQQQELTHHEWVVRGFGRWLGDDAPMLVGTEFVSAQRLVAIMIEWVADFVTHREGGPPEHIAVAHSTVWGPYRTHVVYQALAQLGLTDVTLLPEPIAVGLDYASRQQVEEGATLVIGNIGASSFSATVLRRRGRAFDVASPPLDTDHPGGQDLDDEIFRHLCTELGEQIERLDHTDVRHRATVAQLRAECVRVKEALSHQPEVPIRVELPDLRTQVPLSRAQYEKLARTHLERVPDLLLQAVQSASIDTDQLDAVVLSGGTARTPLLKQLVAQRLQRPALVDGAPELVAARGAATAAVEVLSADTDKPAFVEETSLLRRLDDSGLSGDPDDGPEPVPPRPPVEVEPMVLEEVDDRRRNMIRILKLCIAVILVVGGVGLTVWQSMHSNGTPQSPIGSLFH